MIRSGLSGQPVHLRPIRQSPTYFISVGDSRTVLVAIRTRGHDPVEKDYRYPK